MYYKFLSAPSVFLEVNRPLWSKSGDSFCGKFLCVGWLADNRPVWSVVTVLVGMIKAASPILFSGE
jgi:hypothetical protein